MDKHCLIIVDMQEDLINPKGALYVKNSEQLIPNIKDLIDFIQWDLVVFTQDWHPQNHISFNTSHENKKPGETVMTKSGQQELWPPHCLQNHSGSQISSELLKSVSSYVVVQKGYHPQYDSYSGFADHSNRIKTGLDEILKSFEIEHVYICGVAANYCVKYTALHSSERGYKTCVVRDAVATTSYDLDDDLDLLKKQGIHVVSFV